MVDEAVLPPQKGDVSPSDESSFEAKDGTRMHAKEVDMV